MPNHIHGRRAQHVVVLVGQCLTGRHDDRITRVHTEWIKVLHVTHSNAVVPTVTHHLVLDFFPATHTLFHKHLWTVCKGCVAQTPQLVFVLRKARAKTTQRKGRSHDHREANVVRRPKRLVPRVRTG